ncbi:MAG TPA: hydroxymethylbilane synthase [Ktedonobacteraceae bacterium]|nr:hydroxymethylbilane synthase [Ktedonobacteraceae bacterium]
MPEEGEDIMLQAIALARLGTRGSILARWQTSYVCQLLQTVHRSLAVEIEIIQTSGDQMLDMPLPQIGGKGVFTAELEAALYGKSIDIAVHSLKDLPTELPPGLSIGAIPLRATPADVLVSRQGYTLDTLPEGAIVGTSSQRRKAQILYRRPDLRIIDARGNVNTRIRKALDANGAYDAVVLAQAGLERLEYSPEISQVIPCEQILPAPGQGALGIQCREEHAWLDLLADLNHRETLLAVTAERAFLKGLGGGCSMPVAAYAHIEGEQLHLDGRVCALDGSAQMLLSMAVAITSDLATVRACAIAEQAGLDLARSALEQGAMAMLEAR